MLQYEALGVLRLTRKASEDISNVRLLCFFLEKKLGHVSNDGFLHNLIRAVSHS